MNRIRECRKNKGLTLQQLSEELAKDNLTVSADALSKYERGDREPKLETWAELARFFQVPVSYLQGVDYFNHYEEISLPPDDFKKLFNNKQLHDIAEMLSDKQITKENLLAFNKTFSNTVSLLAYLRPQGANESIKQDLLNEFSKLIGRFWFYLYGKEPIISSVRLPNEKQEKAEKVNYDNLLALLKELNDKAEKGFSDDKD